MKKEEDGCMSDEGARFKLKTDFDTAMRKLIITPKPKTGGKVKTK